jgi:hypothetical protein
MTLSLSRPSGRLGRTILALAAALALVVTAPLGAQAQQRQPIAGTTVSLEPMEGFKPSTQFAGLENPTEQASLLVVEMPPEAHDQLAALFGSLDAAKAGFARQNITVSAADDIATAGGTGRLITGVQKVGDVTFDKWIVLLKGAKTVMVTVQAPESSDIDADEVVDMLMTVSLGAEPSVDEKLASLPFRIKAAEPFRVVDTFGGLGVVMTSGPLNTDPEGKQPLLIASFQTAGAVPADKLAAAGETLLKATKGFETAEIAKRETVRFAGGDGAMLAGTIGSGEARKRFVQYIGLGPEGRFVRMIVNAPDAGFAALEPAIKAIADSVSFPR